VSEGAGTLSLSEKVLAIEAGFAKAAIEHAFGGAIALAYYATPRGTIDIDVNVFVPVERAADVVAALETLGVSTPTESEFTMLVRDGQVRLAWGRTPIDLFFAYDPFHAACLERRVRMPFAEGRDIHVLSAEDLVVFKTIFDRDKDWRDLRELAFAMEGALDRSAIDEWLGRILADGDPRRARCRRVLDGDED